LGRHGDKDALVVAFEHVLVAALALLALKQHIHLDFAVLVTSLLVVDVALAVEVGDNDNTFFVVVIVKQPSSRDYQYQSQIAQRVRLAWEIRKSKESQG
jgi:hypothetical protein